MYFSVDATEETGCLGRLVNHGNTRKERNAVMRVMGGPPILCLFAIRNIAAGEEILYDYGIKKLPWLIVSIDQLPVIHFS